MGIKVLDKAQVNEASVLLLDYKYVYVCSKCNRVYGSDFLDNTGLCPTHIRKEVKA